MKERKTFWDKNAGRYDRFMRKDRAAYEEMYKLIRPVVKAKTVLELATGTGLIAKHIVNHRPIGCSVYKIIGIPRVSSRENYLLARGDCYDFLPDSTHV